MDEKRYHALADATLTHCCDQLEDAFENAQLDELDLQGGILTIMTPSGRTFLLSKHAPTAQLWYASPLLGGLHFRFDDVSQSWRLPDGSGLYDLLCADLKSEQVEVVL